METDVAGACCCFLFESNAHYTMDKTELTTVDRLITWLHPAAAPPTDGVVRRRRRSLKLPPYAQTALQTAVILNCVTTPL